MRFSRDINLGLSVAVFVLLLGTGFLLSEHKLIWIDESFSQHVSVDKPSYLDILALKFPDGNRCPLFYVGQKLVSNILSFHYPDLPKEGSFDLPDRRSQIIMRLAPNFYMSLGLALIFYYFARVFSLQAAVFALVTALVSPMVWMYWAEARPYSLWFLLTTAQLLLYCSMAHGLKVKAARYMPWVHMLLIFTTPGGILQVWIIGVMILIKDKTERGHFKVSPFIPFIWNLLLPTAAFLFYYLLVPEFKIKTFFFLTVLFDAVLPERLFVYAVYALTAWVLSRRQKRTSSNAFFLPIFLLFLMSASLLMATHLFTPQFQFGFFNRYLIFLVPADILMFSLAGVDLWQWSRGNIWVCMNVTIFLLGLTVMRALMTYRGILGSGLYLH